MPGHLNSTSAFRQMTVWRQMTTRCYGQIVCSLFPIDMCNAMLSLFISSVSVCSWAKPALWSIDSHEKYGWAKTSVRCLVEAGSGGWGHARLSNGSVGANFVLHRTQNLLQGTCSENGLGANQSKYLLQQSKYLLQQSKYLLQLEQICAPSSKSLDRSKWFGIAPKMHHFNVKYSKFPGGGPPAVC